MTTCSDCGQDHEQQRVDYPLGAVVKARHNLTGYTYNVQAGSPGRVVGHCDDGRAIIDFGGVGSHTFHVPDGYIELDEVATLRAELARVTEERDRLREALEPFAKVADIINYPVHDPKSMYIWSRNSTVPGGTYGVTLADCQRARAALSSTSTPAAPPETAAGE